MARLIIAIPAVLLTAFGAIAHAQDPANLVAFTLTCTIPAGQSTCTAQVPLPAGKRIVLEHVSARAQAPAGHTIQLYVSTSSMHLPGGTITARHFVTFVPSVSGTFYFASQPLRMYGTTGSYVLIHGQRIVSAGPSGPVQYEVYFTGYLMP